MTSEHAWPQWIAKYLPKKRWPHYHVIERHGEDPEVKTRGEGRFPFTTKVNCVCEPCNTGWMHEIETSVEPIFAPLIEGKTTNRKGNPWRWAEWHQTIAATWATKTALMLEEAQSVEGRAIPREFAPPFYRHM